VKKRINCLVAIVVMLANIFLVVGCDDGSTNTGSWRINGFVDQWGDRTGNYFITNLVQFRGNTIHVGLNITTWLTFIIVSEDNISMELRRFTTDPPYRGFGNNISGSVRDSAGNTFSVRASDNGRGRYRFTESSSRAIHDALMKGGKVLLRLEGTRGERISFDIRSTRGYDNAYRILRGN